jgi:hypothetical protein
MFFPKFNIKQNIFSDISWKKLVWIGLQGPGVPALKVIYHTSQNSLAAKRTIFGKVGIRPAELIYDLIRKFIVYHLKLPDETCDVPAERDTVQHSGNRARKRFPQFQLFRHRVHGPVRRLPHGFRKKHSLFSSAAKPDEP